MFNFVTAEIFFAKLLQHKLSIYCNKTFLKQEDLIIFLCLLSIESRDILLININICLTLADVIILKFHVQTQGSGFNDLSSML